MIRGSPVCAEGDETGVRTAIQGGWFDDEQHRYFDANGNFVPSLTQILKWQGFVDYSAVDDEVLENAARRGTEVHALAAAYNQFGEVDPAWVSEECQPYFDAYMKFLRESRFVPDPQWSEKPMIARVNGYAFGCTPDIFGKRGRDQVLIEFKCAAKAMDHWSIQTAAQEGAIFNSNHCGRVRRHTLMLRKDGTYKLLPEYTDHAGDMAEFAAALRNCWWRLNHGQRFLKDEGDENGDGI